MTYMVHPYEDDDRGQDSSPWQCDKCLGDIDHCSCFCDECGDRPEWCHCQDVPPELRLPDGL